MTVLMTFVLPAAARADCDVTENGIPDDAVATIDPGGVRHALANVGFALGGFYVGETFGNPSGGTKQGATYDGVLEFHLNGDMQKMGLWKDLCFHANAYQIHGQSITASNIGSLMAVSSFEARPATRLFELWFEQSLFEKQLAVRFGQLAADSEFLINDGGTHFLNSTWGWPSITAVDLPGGGPAYPLATPGIRVAVNPNDQPLAVAGTLNLIRGLNRRHGQRQGRQSLAEDLDKILRFTEEMVQLGER
jgi:porin